MSKDPDLTVVKRGSTDPDETVFSPSTAAAGPPPEPPIQATPSSPESSAAIDRGTGPERVGTGTIINNRFVIENVLGEGGMGIVYRALDKRKEEARDRNPHVAVKILSKDFESHPQAFIALQRETRKSQTLAHPNIITVYDFDRDGETVFMTMEELKGKTLDKVIAEHPQGLEKDLAVQMIKSIADGLAYAHSKNIVHSDLKPGNVFVTEDHFVKILDFGIARAVSGLSEEAGDKTLFDAQELGGLTPTYATCEMFAGQEPDPSDDIFALGLIGYELLTGHHPYQRTPANAARESGLVANRIKGIKSFQARALLDSVALEREDRIEDAARFLSRFDRTPNSTRALMVGAAIAVLVLSPLIVLQSGNQGPEIPFEDLPEQVQADFRNNLNNGTEAMEFGDFNGAVYFYNEAYKLHPRNPEAVEGLQSVVDAVLGAQLSGSELEVAGQRLSQVEALLEYDALSDNSRLLDLRESLTSSF